MKPTAPDAMTVGVLATGYFSAPIAVELVCALIFILRELFADAPVDLVCDRVRVEREPSRNPRLKHSPNSNRLLLRFSAMISQLRFTPHNCVSFALHTERSLRRIGWKYHALIIQTPFTAASRPKAIC
jgi:hypothetical protein